MTSIYTDFRDEIALLVLQALRDMNMQFVNFYHKDF